MSPYQKQQARCCAALGIAFRHAHQSPAPGCGLFHLKLTASSLTH